MTKKLEKNGLWEGSRMMLPEHKARLQEASRESKRRQRPVYDPSRREEIGERLGEAYRSRSAVELLLYDPWEERRVDGTIDKVDGLARRLLVGGEWIKLADIVDIRSAEDV